MHFDIFVEDLSGKTFLDLLLKDIIKSPHSFKINPYKGVGRLPKNLSSENLKSSSLLNNLPKIMRGLSKTYSAYSSAYEAVAMVVCDLDDKCLVNFRNELYGFIDSISPKPQTIVCIAIEEMEAWLLGDQTAVLNAYPKARKKELIKYKQDKICGTWESLADVVHPGKAKALKKRPYTEIGAVKSEWAKSITPHMNPNKNESPSFQYFYSKIQELIQE